MTRTTPRRMTGAAGLAALSAAAALGGCAPTLKVQVEPISIYAKLDADVRIRLDQEVQTLIQKNPNLF